MLHPNLTGLIPYFFLLFSGEQCTRNTRQRASHILAGWSLASRVYFPFGDRDGIRTHDTGVKVQRLNRLATQPYLEDLVRFELTTFRVRTECSAS